MMRILLLVLASLVSLFSYSQGFKVKEFNQNISDGSAFNAPMDANGHPCGLIKVRTNVAELQFKGDLVGDIENKTNEYWVFMAKGSKKFGILHPNFLPMTIDFGEYGIAEVDSKATYVLTLAETKYKKEKCGVVITVNPENATLYVDDLHVENLSGNGYYQLFLPKGDHVCRVAQKGYRPYVKAVTTGKGAQNLNVELESVMAELEIKSRTETAEIYVDGERKGNGTWKGDVMAGNHRIEARQQNYVSYSQNITVAEKESRAFVIPHLERAKGRVRIETIPSGLPVKIDTEDVGTSPCTVDVETGSHYISCNVSYGLKSVQRKEFEVRTGALTNLRIEIEYKNDWRHEYYQQGYNGNAQAILKLACIACMYGQYDEAFFWINRHPKKENAIISTNWNSYEEEFENEGGMAPCDWIRAYCDIGNPEKALELWSNNSYNHYHSPKGYRLNDIGDAFFKKSKFDQAITCYTRYYESCRPTGSYARGALEKIGDCYRAKGNKQLAANYYGRCLNIREYLDEYEERIIEQKLREMGY